MSAPLGGRACAARVTDIEQTGPLIGCYSVKASHSAGPYLLLPIRRDRWKQPCTKTQLAEVLGRARGTIDRSISRLRADGLIACEPTYDVHGAQCANAYRLASGGALLTAQELS